ncbi:hypothetical protein DERF_000842 [Dermatophagoides farinae]|uniref:Uncharacterized protein n=1 Tax=Dermatophagoides farinae TaxID=6954 RepID=A0A922HUW6_DERFA|nr:hypothetical protein DERF_009876 [Dermatophagoides farinae]KAH9526780.1 hypothetical protein DERF_000842 [Dermatophagoides farinae]
MFGGGNNSFILAQYLSKTISLSLCRYFPVMRAIVTLATYSMTRSNGGELLMAVMAMNEAVEYDFVINCTIGFNVRRSSNFIY